MGRDHQMPIGLGRETNPFIAHFHRHTEFLQAGSDQVADFVEEIIALRTRVERKMLRCQWGIGFGCHGISIHLASLQPKSSCGVCFCRQTMS